ncbi:extracellular solute-binding protein [Bacillus niameyensis]|uniref:extracellular solute-binding protein n=1 Tax=Bacillus niameyensis TaxID=1522308 RepID=UPI000781A6D2|nr:extracellular solute-binding protein [Bacillus niameyensis]
MRLNRKLFLLAVSILLVLAACSNKETSNKTADNDNVNKSGMPIVNDSITLKMMVGKGNHYASIDWDDLLVWQEYEKMTNIHIDWEQVAGSAIAEKRNLALGAENLPDVFYHTSLSNVELYEHGKQGSIIALNDLIDDYAPNLKQILDESPEIRKAITFPDGNIYSFPTVVSKDFLSLRVQASLWLNQTWLDQLGMDVPETTDEFYEYLKAIKEQDPSGGKVDAIPYGGTNMDELFNFLLGSFGIGNKGRANPNIDLDPDEDKVRFYANTERYKSMLEYLHKLYSEKLIAQNIFSIETNQFLANATEGVYGAAVHWNPVTVWGGDIGKEFVSGIALEGPYGDQNFVKVSPITYSMGNFAITKENKNPAATVRWLDHFYSEEGVKLFYMGIEGETYQEASDGRYEYVEKITNSPDGLTFEQEAAKYVPWFGMPMGTIKEEFFLGTASSEGAIEAANKVAPYIPEEIWPQFTYTDDESKVLASIGADIDKYVVEMRDKFITGNEPLSKWDDYVKTLDNMGLEEYMEIKQAAYERYKNN